MTNQRFNNIIKRKLWLENYLINIHQYAILMYLLITLTGVAREQNGEAFKYCRIMRIIELRMNQRKVYGCSGSKSAPLGQLRRKLSTIVVLRAKESKWGDTRHG